MNTAYNPHLLGRQGEEIAADYLANQGYHIIARNYRFHHNEIDIIARHQHTLCFVEVKTRLSSEKGHPSEAVTYHKQKEIIKAARAFLAHTRQETGLDCRFDVVAILVKRMEGERIATFTIEHLTDAFWATA